MPGAVLVVILATAPARHTVKPMERTFRRPFRSMHPRLRWNSFYFQVTHVDFGKWMRESGRVHACVQRRRRDAETEMTC